MADQLRLSCFSIDHEAEEEPFQQIDVGGLLSVWIRDEGLGLWRSVKHIPVLVVWVFEMYRRMELPVGAA